MEWVLFIFAVAAMSSMAVAPWLIYHRLKQIEIAIDYLNWSLSGDEDDGPDGDDGEPLPRENIVTLARSRKTI